MLRIVRERARRDDVENITTVVSTPSDPNLEPNSVDLLFTVDVYHELEFPVRAADRP